MRLGIDFGISFSRVAILENGETRAMKVGTALNNIGNEFLLPSAVFVNENGSMLVGQAAINERLKKSANFKKEFKRYLGQPISFLLGGKEWYPQDL